jgi:CHAD domain-containing protein
MLRALLALLAGGFEERSSERAEGALEKIARSLAPVRDAEVRLQTLEYLLEVSPAPSAQQFDHVRSLLRAQAASARRLSLTPADLRDVAALAEAARERLLALTCDRKGWRAIGPGLARSYRRGRRSLAEALDDPSPKRRHRWRQRVKVLWNHLRLLQGCQPKKLGALLEKLEALGDALGCEHDLAELRQHLAQHGKRHRSVPAFDAIVALIDIRRAKLRRAADSLGRKLYAPKPDAFTRELKHAWQEWRD